MDWMLIFGVLLTTPWLVYLSWLLYKWWRGYD